MQVSLDRKQFKGLNPAQLIVKIEPTAEPGPDSVEDPIWAHHAEMS